MDIKNHLLKQIKTKIIPRKNAFAFVKNYVLSIENNRSVQKIIEKIHFSLILYAVIDKF